jgi:integrase
LKFLAREVRRVRDHGLTSTADIRKVKYGDLRRRLLASYNELGRKSLRMDAEGNEYICGLPALDSFFGWTEKWDGPPAVTITTEKLRAFTRKRQEDDTGNAAINRSLALIRRMFKLAIREKSPIEMPYIPMLPEPDPRDGFVSREAFQVLLSFLPSHLKPLILLLYTTGVRIGEACQIEWYQVDLDRRVIRLEKSQTKNKSARTLPIVSEIAMLLRDIQKHSGLVFDSTNIRKEWINACVLAGLGTKIEVDGKPYDPRYEGLTIHDLRRSAVRNMVTVLRVREKVAMDISGHKTRSMLDRYNIVDETDIHATRQALDTLQDGEGKNLLSSGDGSNTGKVRRVRKSLTAGKPHKH